MNTDLQQLPNQHFVNGGRLTVADLADTFGVLRRDIHTALATLGLEERGNEGRQPTELATRTRAISGQLWAVGLVSPYLKSVLPGELTIAAPASELFHRNRTRRVAEEWRQAVATSKREESERATLERIREAELSKMAGVERVQLMIAQRTEFLRAQYSPEEWAGELIRMRVECGTISNRHRHDDSYPDFESELVDRVIFEVDEIMCAAVRYFHAGRATSILREPTPETIVAEHGALADA